MLEWLRERAATEAKLKKWELEEERKERQEIEATRKQQGEQLTVRREQLSVSPSSERRANARNVSFRFSLRLLIYIVNSVDKTKLSCNTPTDAAPQFL